MAQYIARAPEIQVSGASVLAVVAAMGMFKARALQLLAEHGIADPRAEQWYPQQAYLNAFREIAQAMGPGVLNMIGRKIPESAHFPPHIDCIERALEAFCLGYSLNNRGDDSKVFNLQLDGARAAKVAMQTPYPCAYERGILEAMVKRFKPADSKGVQIAHDTGCRDAGADSCTYRVAW